MIGETAEPDPDGGDVKPPAEIGIASSVDTSLVPVRAR